MIYSITDEDGKTIALTDEASAIHKFSNLTIRWSSESERIKFRELEAKFKRKPVFVPRLNAALWSVWRVSFWPMYR
jgi:hypothetical protein